VKPVQRRTRDWIAAAAVMAVAVAIILLFPEKRGSVLTTSWDYLREMLFIFPAVLILMGLFAVFVPNEMVINHLGEASGIKGVALSFLLGTLPTGPLYMAFPIAGSLLKKGARVSNIVIFLSAWACIKIPQELVELRFLGIRFMLVRFGLTVGFVIVMGLLIEKIAVGPGNGSMSGSASEPDNNND
jgi:uncharacterized membrane protein YraQ (UPF0718 family)